MNWSFDVAGVVDDEDVVGVADVVVAVVDEVTGRPYDGFFSRLRPAGNDCWWMMARGGMAQRRLYLCSPMVDPLSRWFLVLPSYLGTWYFWSSISCCFW